MLKVKFFSVVLAVLCFAGSVPAQQKPRFSSKYVRPATYGGLFYVYRDKGLIIPRALVLSYDDRPIEQKPNDPDAPTNPGFYLSYTEGFEFERVEVIGKRVYFKTRPTEDVSYEFSGLFGTKTDRSFSPPIPFIEGTLTKLKKQKIVSQEKIKFIHAFIA
jgi:hypothetical protein